MIAIVDYGMGNIRSVEKGFLKMGADARITADPKVISNARGIVLPGVGAFKDCMRNLERLKLLDVIAREIGKGKPYLGICLGLQILFSDSEEFGFCRGMEVLKGKVVRFRFGHEEPGEGEAGGPRGLKIPHMGWNTARLSRTPPPFREIPDNTYFYFVHSYYVVPEEEGVVASRTEYGLDFVSMVWKDNVIATQFHPEKSQEAGLKVLRGFSDMVRGSS
ncbi:MAG: imidazole glycerol phosphate synthase subunit HisH [Thermodesulfovibrionales bacterium]